MSIACLLRACERVAVELREVVSRRTRRACDTSSGTRRLYGVAPLLIDPVGFDLLNEYHRLRVKLTQCEDTRAVLAVIEQLQEWYKSTTKYLHTTPVTRLVGVCPSCHAILSARDQHTRTTVTCSVCHTTSARNTIKSITRSKARAYTLVGTRADARRVLQTLTGRQLSAYRMRQIQRRYAQPQQEGTFVWRIGDYYTHGATRRET